MDAQHQDHTANTPAQPASAAQLRAQLAAARDLAAIEREDVWARRAGKAEHRIAMDTVAERAAAARRARRERAADHADAAALGRLYRKAARSGERARLRAEINRSAEMRALRVAAVLRTTLAAGLPVLAAFAAWSTTGVQAGVVRWLHLDVDSPAWWAAWAVEPALITIVALIIIGRSVLLSSGGRTDWRAWVAEWTALTMSLALNIVGGWPPGADWHGITTALPHSIGPIGCAGTAFLIGLFAGYVADAKPWDGAPRLADLGLTRTPVPPAATDLPDAPAPVDEPTDPWALAVAEGDTEWPPLDDFEAELDRANLRPLTPWTSPTPDQSALPAGPDQTAASLDQSGAQLADQTTPDPDQTILGPDRHQTTRRTTGPVRKRTGQPKTRTSPALRRTSPAPVRLPLAERIEQLDQRYPDRIPGRNEAMRDLGWTGADQTSAAVNGLRARRAEADQTSGEDQQ